MPESLARPRIRDRKACIAERCAAKPGSQASIQFRRNPFLAPRSIRRGDVRDQLPQVSWQSRPATRPRFPTPEQPEAFRCHRISVSGFTTVRTERQSINRESATRVIRVASSARRALTLRSRYNANCLRKNRFSAARYACERHMHETNRRTSPATRRVVRTKTAQPDSALLKDDCSGSSG